MLFGKGGRQRVTGGRRAADDDAGGGIRLQQPVHELRRHADLADADGVDPQALALRQRVDGLARFFVKESDALGEVAPAAVAAAHFDNGSRQHADEAERKREVVESEAKSFRCHARVGAARRCGWSHRCGQSAPASRASWWFGVWKRGFREGGAHCR